MKQQFVLLIKAALVIDPCLKNPNLRAKKEVSFCFCSFFNPSLFQVATCKSMKSHCTLSNIIVTFGNQIFREKMFGLPYVVVNQCLAIVNFRGFRRMEVFIYQDFQIRPLPIGFENLHLSGFAHPTLFFLAICIDTHQYQSKILNYKNPQRRILNPMVIKNHLIYGFLAYYQTCPIYQDRTRNLDTLLYCFY